MRVLHVAHDSLPDARIERAAMSAQKKGWEAYYAGSAVRGTVIADDAFKSTITIPFSRCANLHLKPAWTTLKKRFLDVLSKTRPDVVHAHNIIAAKLALESEVSFVYDDHEYWSRSSRLTNYRFHELKGRAVSSYARRIWTRWEKQVLAEAPVLTVSETIAEEHRKLANHVFVIPNMPTAKEIPQDPLSAKRPDVLSSVYVGKDVSSPTRKPVRDVSGLTELFYARDVGRLVVIGDEQLVTKPPVYSTGFMDHRDVMGELTKHHVGLIPWKPFSFHRYCNPNKAYEYVHAGLLVLATSDLTPVLMTLGPYCTPIRDYEGLAETLAELKANLDDLESMRGAMVSYARNHCLWENYEGKIFDAYSLA
jgi:glycosyltransferase involved in cell wall biosynthesis